MIGRLTTKQLASGVWVWGVVMTVLLAATLSGLRASTLWLILPCLGIGLAILIQRPIAGLFAVVPAALLVRLEFGTGTEVALNPVTLMVPAVLGIWVLDMMRRGELRLAPSATNRPLLLFLASGLLSLVIGIGTWDPIVPRSSSFAIVQMAQWAIFAFAAIAFWLTGNLVQDVVWLRRFTFFFLAVAGGLAIVRTLVGLGGNAQFAQLVGGMTTTARERAPFWMILTALAAGQLLFNQSLTTKWRAFLLAVLAAVAVFTLYLERQTAANWLGIAAAAGILGWLRWPRLRWPVILLLILLGVSGVLSSTVYEFAGGDSEWVESGGSRLALIGRVIEVTMRNPITGLGPAAYRNYAGIEPLFYRGAYWIAPNINSHNNYVDLFSQMGLLGLALFFWFVVELARLGLHLRARFNQGFAAGYVNAMLAMGVGALLLMLFADWILPFVYNIGFPGFQASVLVWLFLGGLVALEQVTNRESTG